MVKPQPIIVGAVLYDPKVAQIWDIIKDFFASNHCPIDVVFYSNYELQNRGLLSGHLDIAWNSPLAWLEAQHLSQGTCRAIAMRDSDQQRRSHIVVKSDGPQSLAELKGQVVALGASDSPQANLIPQGLLQRQGLVAGRDFQVLEFNLLLGMHGDHIGGELEAFRALQDGRAAASAVLDLNWQSWTENGTADPSGFRILASSDPFDHCVFTVRQDFDPARQERWLEVLHSMSYDNPEHRTMMDLEGLKAWKPGRVSGFGPLQEAVQALGLFQTVAV